MNVKTEITKLHYKKDPSGFFFNILKFCSVFYGLGSGFKNFLYDKNILHPTKVDAKVISVGNLTTGGVGKTPVVNAISKYLIENGHKVAIISRGYGGKLSNKNVNVISDGEKVLADAQMAGDEPYWHATNSSAVVITCKDRVRASKFAVANFGVTHIILDDGFQHRKIFRDLDLVLADSEKWFGNECLLPAGPLREGKEAFKRIDKLVVVSKNSDHTKAEKLVKIMSKKMKLPTFLCKTEPDITYGLSSGEFLPAGQKVTTLCAIGQPEQFINFVKKDYEVVNSRIFDDHHAYRAEDLNNLGDFPIITTEKDAVKLKDFDVKNVYALKLKVSIDVENLLGE